jgi:DNA-binding IclR family transcriptional regulator
MVKASNSLAKMLALLDAFTVSRHVWTVEALAIEFGYTQPSTYRYVRELCKAGLLARMPAGEYVIGARIVELDWLITTTDPLTKEYTPMMESMTQLLGCHTLLSNVYGEHLINVAHIPGSEKIDLTFVRGRRLPWFRGSTSNAILAFLPRKRVRKLFDDHYEGERSRENWKMVLAELNSFSELGYSISDGGLQPGVLGIGAPVIVGGEVLGSLSLVFSESHGRLLDRAAVGEYLVKKCAEFAEKLDDSAFLKR